MSLAVPDKNRAVRIDKNSVGPGHAAMPRVARRPVTTLAVAGNQFERPALHLDPADTVALGVGQINIGIRPHAQSFWAGQQGRSGRAFLSAESWPARATDVAHQARRQIEFVNGI